MILTRVRTVAPLLLTGLLVVAWSGELAAQERRSIVASAGLAPYDLSGTGTTGIYGLSAAFPLQSVLVAETGVRYLHYGSQFGRSTSYLMPEVGLQVQAALRASVHPYLGVGAGPALVRDGDTGNIVATLHAALGARIPLGDGWLLRPEARLRSVDPWAGSDLELTAGVGHVFSGS